MFSKEQAKLIIEAHDINECIEDEEEVQCLEEHNPELLQAYYAILDFANS